VEDDSVDYQFLLRCWNNQSESLSIKYVRFVKLEIRPQHWLRLVLMVPRKTSKSVPHF
jgi:hypothetical protein